MERAMPEQDQEGPGNLLLAPPRVVNIGLELFAMNLASYGAKVVHVQWSPPAGGNSHLAGLLDRLRS
jgi:FdrA protein